MLPERRHRFVRRARLRVASFRPQPLRAYTLSFDHADYDESAIAEEQARLSGAEFWRIDIRSEHMADHFADALYHAERPFANAHVVAKYLLSRAVRDSGIKVVLTGEGSDEILAGYPHFRRDAVLYGSDGLDAATKQQLLAQLEEANRVSAGTAHAAARDDASKALGGRWASCRRSSRRGRRSAPGCCRVASDDFR